MLDLIRTGLTNAEIAVRLGLSINTVKYHVTNLHAKANSDSREALRAWQPSRARRNPLGLLSPLLPGLKWLAAAAVVTGIGIAVAATIAVLANREGTPEPTAPAAQVATPVRDLPELASDRVSPVQSIAIVVEDIEGYEVRLIDPQSAAELGRATTGYNAIATFRRAAGELLISHLGTSTGADVPVLDVLDAGNALSLKRQVPVPDRAGWKRCTGRTGRCSPWTSDISLSRP